MADAGERLRVAVVGASATGRGWAPVAHLPAIAAVDEFELVAVGASSPDSAAAASEAYGVAHGFHDVRDLAATPDIEVVVVAVKVPHHHDIVMPLLEAGKHVYCEWPLGATTAEAQAMAAAARDNGVVAIAGLQGRHDPTLTHIGELVARGWLGDVLSVNVTMLGGGALSHTSSEAWMADRSNGANTMTIVGGHTLDTLEHCFGSLVDVSAMIGVQVPQWHLADTGDIVDVDAPDTILVNGTLASGGLVSYFAASVPHHGAGWRMEAYGTEATLVASSAALPQITPVTLMGAQGDKPLAPVPVPEADRAAVPDGPGRNIARSYRRMAEAIRAGSAATPDFDDALRVHRLLDALEESSDQHHTTGAPS